MLNNIKERFPQGLEILNAWRRGDIAFALSLMAILMMLIIPLPRWLMDLSLAISITFSILILMTALFINRPLDFSSFPTVLLVSTMLRLALNVASTRLILTNGHLGENAAGEIIRAFGNFVMSGNYVIGIIVFTILVIVNFVVITKGSGRIAEVSARFSLDAMPGKQMAIDADLSAGLIDESQAKERRKRLEDESNFYGSMDGAAKFVRGDAIAGLLITLINIIGGIIIGVVQQNISFSVAIRTYTLLTIGDGLVTQIPALIVSTAAGMIVSKSGVEGSAEKALFEQLCNYPHALGVSSFLLLIMALVPGMPKFPFLLLSMATGSLSWYVIDSKNKGERQKEEEEKQRQAEIDETNNNREEIITQSLRVDPIRIELGYGLLDLIHNSDPNNLANQIKILRKQIAKDIGFIVPAVRIQDNIQLPSNNYSVKIKEIESGRGDIRAKMLLVMDPMGRPFGINGEPTKEPTFGLPAMWIDPNLKEQADLLGYTVVDPNTVIITHVTEIIKDNMADLLSYTDVQKLVDEVAVNNSKLIADVIPNQFTISVLQRVLQNMLRERVPIRDLITIIESMAEISSNTKNSNIITEYVRSKLARQLCCMYEDDSGTLPIVSVNAEWEQIFQESLIGPEGDKQLALAPSQIQQFASKVREVFERQAALGKSPVLLTSPTIRPYVRSIIDRMNAPLAVMSQNEIYPKVKIQTLDYIAN